MIDEFQNAHSTISVPVTLLRQFDAEKRKLEAEVKHRVSKADFIRHLLTNWEERHSQADQLTPEDIKRLKDLIAQNE